MPAERLPRKGMSKHQRQALRAAAMARALRLISIGRLQPRPKSLSFYNADDHNPSGPRTNSMMPMVFELITMLAVLGLGFVLGRIWEIRQQEILRLKHEQAGFEIPIAYLPH
jgi:hypothetical protein